MVLRHPCQFTALTRIVSAGLSFLLIGFNDANAAYWAIDGYSTRISVEDKTGVPPIVTGNTSAKGIRLRLGGSFNKWLDAEVQLGGGPNSHQYSTAGGDNKISAATVSFVAKPKLQLGPVSIYGAFGFADVSYGFEGPVHGDQSRTGLTYGGGLQVDIGDKFAVSIDYMTFPKGNLPVNHLSGGIDAGVKAVAAGLIYKF